jgi:zinc protease
VTRASKDWPALALAVSYLGQHRSSNGVLFQRLREARGLNYGDYAYIEYFPRGMAQLVPDPNLGRQQQIFQIWVRPVEPRNGLFALRAALYEYDKLVSEGISRESFEATREFLQKYSSILTQTQDLSLGYALDSRYYGIEDYAEYLEEELSKITHDDVNRVIGRHLRSDRMRIVVVTKDAESFSNAIIANAPSAIAYNSAKPKQITDEDRIIENYNVKLKPEDIVIIPAERVFQ